MSNCSALIPAWWILREEGAGVHIDLLLTLLTRVSDSSERLLSRATSEEHRRAGLRGREREREAW